MNLFYILPIFLIKRLFLKNLYLQVLFPILGLFQFIKVRGVSKPLVPLILVPVVSLMYGVFLMSPSIIARSGQFLCLVFFADFVFRYFTKKGYFTFFKVSLILGFVVNILALIVAFESLPLKPFLLGIKLPMFDGLIGEPNYSAFFFLGAMAYFVSCKNIKYSLFSFVLIGLCASRSMMVAGTLLIPFLFLKSEKMRGVKLLSGKLLLILMVLYPLILMGLYKSTSQETHNLLTKVTNGRFAIHSVYASIFTEKPMGIGYFQGRKQFNDYKIKQDVLFPINHISLYDYNYEPHSVFMQVLSELGVIAYILFSYFLFNFQKMLFSRNIDLACIFTVMFFPLTQLNGLSEIVIYVLIGYCLSILAKENRVETLYIKDLLKFRK